MAGLFEDYELDRAFDEMFGRSDAPREPYAALYARLRVLSKDEFAERCATRDRSFRDQGITFSLSGEERPFPLDLVPRVIGPEEWAVIERGVAQRVRALELFLDDVYGAGECFEAGIIPRRLVYSSSHFHREAIGINPPNGVRRLSSSTRKVPCSSRIKSMPDTWTRTPFGGLMPIASR
jgi:uncharacterized circularly permuted ATP-grasp superfamily protein